MLMAGGFSLQPPTVTYCEDLEISVWGIERKGIKKNSEHLLK
jgi:hypothetical protein